MSYCLDTNTVIYFLKGRYPELQRKLLEHRPDQLVVPEIVRAELLTGVAKSDRPQRSLSLVNTFLEPLSLLPFSGSAVEHYANIRAELEAKGTVIGPNDLIVAAIARANSATLVTHNIKEFKRVPGLAVVDWTCA